MNKLDNRGFTLIELIATIVILSVILGFGGYTITSIIKNTKEKDYENLISEINNAVETYYIECRYSGVSDVPCDTSGNINLKYLIDNGYLNSNVVTGDGTNGGLVNPVNEKDITNCEIKYEYVNGDVVISAVNPIGDCPNSY